MKPVRKAALRSTADFRFWPASPVRATPGAWSFPGFERQDSGQNQTYKTDSR
jgi:hypothetical protein